MKIKQSTIENHFDFDAYEAQYQNKLKENKKIKKASNDKAKVYCNLDYAQDLYNKYVDAIPENFKAPEVGEVIQGRVLTLTKDKAYIDINWRENAVIELRKENPEFYEYLMPDYPIEVLVEEIKTQSNNTKIRVSYTSLILNKFKNELIDSIGQNIAYQAKVIELVNAGYMLDISGVKCFMPGSLGGMNKLINFEELLNQTIYVVPVNYAPDKDYVVVSHREYLKALVPGEMDKLEVGMPYEGFVTGVNKSGVFVEFNKCLTGLILFNELSDEYKELFRDHKIKPGDDIKFNLKSINGYKLNLTQFDVESALSSWNNVNNTFKEGNYYIGTIKKITNYGAFIELKENITGLLHRSRMNENVELLENKEIKTKIISIDKENRQIVLSM